MGVGGDESSSATANVGLIPRAVELVRLSKWACLPVMHVSAHLLLLKCFQMMASRSGKAKCYLKVSYLEIYNDKLIDLLSPIKKTMAVVGDGRRGITVRGLVEKQVGANIFAVSVLPHWWRK